MKTILALGLALLLLSGCTHFEPHDDRFYKKDGNTLVRPEELQRAADYLQAQLSPELKTTIRKGVSEEGDTWLIKRHRAFGMYIRNTLRDGGFAWGQTLLEDYWRDVIQLMLKNENKP